MWQRGALLWEWPCTQPILSNLLELFQILSLKPVVQLHCNNVRQWWARAQWTGWTAADVQHRQGRSGLCADIRSLRQTARIQERRWVISRVNARMQCKIKPLFQQCHQKQPAALVPCACLAFYLVQFVRINFDWCMTVFFLMKKKDVIYFYTTQTSSTSDISLK